MIGAYAGRFQPFCIHHRAVAQFIDSQPDITEVVIVKGSSQWSDQNHDTFTSSARHPFTADECCAMIDLSLAGRIKKPYRIVRVLDTKTILTDPLWREWVEAVVAAINAKEFVLFANDSKVVRAFERAGIECRPFPVEYPGASATAVRRKLACEPREIWSRYVDREVADYLEMIQAPARVRRLLEEYS